MSSFLPENEIHQTVTEPSRQAEIVRLLAANYRQIFASAMAIVGRPEDADDIAQDACVVIWEKHNEFELGTNFRKWACQIAFNIAKSYVRKQRRHGVGLSDEALAKVIQMRSAGSELFELRRERLRQCLKKLSREDRQFLASCYRSSTSIIELAAKQGRTPASVNSKLQRLRKRLTECVHRRYPEGETL
jgi:RNA polymerase sigma-70 factor (ECF subfamily)